MDWKAARERSGLTLEQLAERVGYGVSTINGLELRGEGSERLKEKLLEVLGPYLVAESVKDPLVLQVKDAEDINWKERALNAERQLASLREALRSLLSLTESKPGAVSSVPPSEAARAAAEAGKKTRHGPGV